MKELLQACLNKEPQNVHTYTPTPTTLGIQLQYRNGMIVEIVEAENGRTYAKAVEYLPAANGQPGTAKLKAIESYAKEDVSPEAELVEQVKEKYFNRQEQQSVCEHWALMINGKKNGLEVTKK